MEVVAVPEPVAVASEAVEEVELKKRPFDEVAGGEEVIHSQNSMKRLKIEDSPQQ